VLLLVLLVVGCCCYSRENSSERTVLKFSRRNSNFSFA
jgi:hypothetical protein